MYVYGNIKISIVLGVANGAVMVIGVVVDFGLGGGDLGVVDGVNVAVLVCDGGGGGCGSCGQCQWQRR